MMNEQCYKCDDCGRMVHGDEVYYRHDVLKVTCIDCVDWM